MLPEDNKPTIRDMITELQTRMEWHYQEHAVDTRTDTASWNIAHAQCWLSLVARLVVAGLRKL